MGTASDPFAAAQQLEREVPDVITLDVEMPKMDGLTFLEKIMSQHPIPVVICSSLTEAGSDGLGRRSTAARSRSSRSPRSDAQFLQESTLAVCDAVKAAASGRVPRARRPPPRAGAPSQAHRRRGPAEGPPRRMSQTTEKVIAVGASTGGTEALRDFLRPCRRDGPGIVIVQHMPENSRRLRRSASTSLCGSRSRKPRPATPSCRGQALIAPGNQHIRSSASGARYSSSRRRPARQPPPALGRRALPFGRPLRRAPTPSA